VQTDPSVIGPRLPQIWVCSSGGKRRSVTLFCHIDSPRTRYFAHGGDDAMHFANYIVLGFLIVCMLSAAAMVLSRAKSH
jgi:hypothetical protein